MNSLKTQLEVNNGANLLTEERWQAIITNDIAHDDKFFYGVKTTGIFCRPSCKSRAPKFENVQIFLKAEDALSEQFRPCKRCKPSGLRLPNEAWIEQIAAYIDVHYDQPITLESISDIFHGSLYHLQRTFKKFKDMTPIQYIQKTRIGNAKKLLKTTDKTINEVSMLVGIPNTAHFATLFKKFTCQTPSEYRRNNQKK